MADFKLGRLKFKWRGDWATSTAYVVDDIVKYGGNTYVCVTNHTSQSTSAAFYTDLSTNSYWQLHTEGLYFKGDWAQSTHYKLNDLVKYGAFQYRTTTQHTSTSSFDNTKFEVYTEGLQFEDSYNASTTYQDGDVVSYGGYAYVYINSTPSSGQTPTDNSYWDILTTGYNNSGTYSHGTAYKTGDVVQYGGYVYVANANHSSQYPANTDGTTNSSYWDLLVKGFDYQSGGYSGGTEYNIGDVVRYESTSYVMLKDRQTGVTPGTDATVWQVLAQGDTGAVLSTRGDLIYQDASQTARLPIGTSGAVLTTDGVEPVWSNAEGKNVIYVANGGSDTNSGTQFLPYATIAKALSVVTSGDAVALENISGGTGGTPGTYDVTQTSSTGSGLGIAARITTDGSSTPTIIITDGGRNHTAGDTITIAGSQLGSSSDLTFDILSASVGDVIFVKNGVYRETLPLRVPAGITVRGESLRGTEVRPASGTGTQIKTVTSSSTIAGATDGTYNYIHQTSTDGSGDGLVVNITIASNVFSSVSIYHGGYGHAVNDQITFTVADIGCGGTGSLVLTAASLEDNNASNMWLLNNTTNITEMSFKGLTGTPGAGGTSKASVTSLDPEGSITTSSPYIQNCSSVNSGATGVQIDGNLHSAGNKSILANDFTQINSDGIGVHALGNGRGEMVSIFTYYCAKSFYAQSGGFIRGLNCSSAYGEKGAEADGTNASETPVNVTTRGSILKYDATTFGGAATESDITSAIATSGQGTATVSGGTSGASATIFRTNISLDYLHIESISGTFTDGETLTITKEDSSTFTVGAASSSAQVGQIGPLIAVSSGSTALSSAGIIKVGTNIKFSGDSTYYRISAVSEEDTGNENALVRLTASIASGDAKADNTLADVTEKFSNIRLTGHDFLDIGTGDVITTNYPNTPSQAADQADEVTETTGGRVYYSSTDQKGDFRVGDLFRIEQATGVATLNADAFDLSGLNNLQLGSVGAELGATINEFSTDTTLAGNSNTAVPTERAVKTYVDSGTTTLTNKTIDLANNTLVGNTAAFNTALSDGSFATLAGSEVLTNKTIDSASNTLTLDLSEGTLTGTTAEFNTALSDGSFATLTGTESLSNKTLTTPKIASGDFIADANGNEQVKFTTTATAVNEFTVTNAATGGSPTIAATGGDTNIDLTINPKGVGRVALGAASIQQTTEKVTNGATAFTGTINFDAITQPIFRATSNASGNWTLNIRGDGSNSLDSIMDTGESLTIVTIVPQGGTAYYNSAVQVDGSSVTPKWQGGAAPTGGNTSSDDIYSYTVVKTGSASFAVYAAQTQFA